MCRAGLAFPKPTFPLEETNSEFVGAPARTVKGVFAPVTSSTENLFKQPLQESFAVSVQTLFGKPDAVEVSRNVMRVLFSFNRIVSKLKLSLLTQSKPTQRLP